MAYGMQIYNTNNTLAYDSTSPGGVFVRFILMPPSTTYMNSPKVETLPLAYAGRIIIIPTIYGDHTWSVSQGYPGSQAPEIYWYDKTYSISILRQTTVLMVFAK